MYTWLKKWTCCLICIALMTGSVAGSLPSVFAEELENEVPEYAGEPDGMGLDDMEFDHDSVESVSSDGNNIASIELDVGIREAGTKCYDNAKAGGEKYWRYWDQKMSGYDGMYNGCRVIAFSKIS